MTFPGFDRNGIDRIEQGVLHRKNSTVQCSTVEYSTVRTLKCVQQLHSGREEERTYNVRTDLV